MYTFSAKERDVETGLSYFGSRYYSSDLSIWLSVDPMSDKYASLSPYVYCANNPIKLVDPNGDTIGHVDEAIQKKIDALTDKSNADYSRSFTRLYNRLEKSKITYNFYEATTEQVQDYVKGITTKNVDGSIDIYSSSFDIVRTSPQGGFSKEYALLFEEIYHAGDYDRGRLDLSHPTCRDEARAWKFSAKAPGTSYWDDTSYSFTFAGVVQKLSITQLSYFFKEGGPAQVDEYGRGENLIGAEYGLYNNLPLK